MIAELLKKNWVILLGIALLGAIVRLLYLDHITFFYDQARDAFEAMSIWHTDPVKIIGPSSDINGINHGPLYWYLISPFYFFSSGNPISVRLFLIALNLVGVGVTYALAMKLFNKRIISFISTFLYAVSFELTEYGRWLSNPGPAVISIGIFFYGYWLALEKKNMGLAIMCAAFMASFQFEFFLAYQGIFIIHALFILVRSKDSIYRNWTKWHTILYSIALFLSTSYILSELKFKFKAVKALLGYVFSSETHSSAGFNLLRYVQTLVDTIGNSITGGISFLSIMVLIIVVGITGVALMKKIEYRKQILFLSLWFFSPIFVHLLNGTKAYFLNIGNSYPLFILSALVIYLISEKYKNYRVVILTVFITIVTCFNLGQILTHNNHGEALLSVQNDMTYNYEKQVIDSIYKESQGKPFALNSVTNPLFYNSTWSFLFSTYGKSKYGYMPEWIGYPQDGVAGADVQFTSATDRIGKKLFVIYEPSTGISASYIHGYHEYENQRSQVIKVIKIKDFTVEERQLINNNAFSRDDLFKLVTEKKL